MAIQTNLRGYFGKAIARKRKSQSDITSSFKKAERNQKNARLCMKSANKHFQNDEEEDDLFVLGFYTVIFLGSLRMKEKQKLKKLFIYF